MNYELKKEEEEKKVVHRECVFRLSRFRATSDMESHGQWVDGF